MAQPLKVLIVEDNPIDAELVVRALRRAGFEPDWQRVDSEAGVQAALNESIQLVLSDYEMPGFSGLAALRAAKARFPDLPFIIVSGTIGEDTAVEAMKLGATDYMIKDRLARLGTAVERALGEQRLQQERKQTQETLHATEERFRQLAENINEVFWLTDPAKERMLYISPAYEAIWGRTADSLQANPKTWMEAIHPDDRTRVHRALVRQSEGSYDEEYRIIRPDLTERWVRDRAYPVRDKAGQVIRIAGVAEDVTDRKQLEAQLLQSQKLEAIGQLSGGVAHDFNNLLTVIKGHIGLLQMDGLVSPSISGSIAQISEAADRAANLTRQLLMFSRRQVFQPENHNLNQLVTNMVKMLRRLLREDIELVVRCADTALPIRADLGMVEQVLLNLVVNARDAIVQAGHITISTEVIQFGATAGAVDARVRPGTFACLRVSDSGTGIPAAVLPRIFEPFFTTKEVGKGTGLGLATVYGIMQQHEGWVAVESEEGSGATFRAFFPLLGRDLPTVSAPQSNEVRRGREMVLLVEDEAAVRAVAEATLSELGYKVVVASNGIQALQIWQIRGHEIGLILTDLVMPGGVNGRQLAERVRQKNPSLPIIYMSGYGHDVAGDDFPLIEGKNYLPKPFDLVQLSAILRENLDSGRVR